MFNQIFSYFDIVFDFHSFKCLSIDIIYLYVANLT